MVQPLYGVRERSLSSDDRPKTTRLGERDRPGEVSHRRRVRSEIPFATVHEVACGDVNGLPPGGDRDESSSRTDRKSTRLNSSHVRISYAVFCLKKKKK